MQPNMQPKATNILVHIYAFFIKFSKIIIFLKNIIIKKNRSTNKYITITRLISSYIAFSIPYLKSSESIDILVTLQKIFIIIVIIKIILENFIKSLPDFILINALIK